MLLIFILVLGMAAAGAPLWACMLIALFMLWLVEFREHEGLTKLCWLLTVALQPVCGWVLIASGEHPPSIFVLFTLATTVFVPICLLVILWRYRRTWTRALL
jgi:hypothetical protein